MKPFANQPMMIVKSRKKMTPTPRRLIPMYCSGRSRAGTSGRTKLSTQPTKVHSSQIVSEIGAMTTSPVRKLALNPAKRRGRGNGGVFSSNGVLMLVDGPCAWRTGCRPVVDPLQRSRPRLGSSESALFLDFDRNAGTEAALARTSAMFDSSDRPDVRSKIRDKQVRRHLFPRDAAPPALRRPPARSSARALRPVSRARRGSGWR